MTLDDLLAIPTTNFSDDAPCWDYARVVYAQLTGRALPADRTFRLVPGGAVHAEAFWERVEAAVPGDLALLVYGNVQHVGVVVDGDRVAHLPTKAAGPTLSPLAEYRARGWLAGIFRLSEVLDLDTPRQAAGVTVQPAFSGIISAVTAWFAALPVAVRFLIGIVASSFLSRLLARPTVSFQESPPDTSRTYSFRGRTNTDGVGLPVPVVYGEHRVFPHIIQQYVDVVSDLSTLYTLLVVSHGQVEAITAPELNEQAIGSYREAFWDSRLGSPTQSAIPWFSDVRNTFNVGVELNEDGQSFVYRTRQAIDKIIARVVFPEGVWGSGGAVGSGTNSIVVRVEHKRPAESAWTSLGDFTVNPASTTKAVVRQYESAIISGAAVKAAGAGTSDSALGAGDAWTTPGNITAQDSAYAIAGAQSGSGVTAALRADAFGFAVPSTATIRGIMLEIIRQEFREGGGVRDPEVPLEGGGAPEGGGGESAGGDPGGGLATVTDHTVQLLKAGVAVGTNNASATAWPVNTDGSITYGGATDLWGTTWTPTDINAATFGAFLQASWSAGQPFVNFMRMTVFYDDQVASARTIRDIRVTRVSSSNSPKPPMLFDSLDEIIFAGALTYPEYALLAVKVQATEQLSGSPPRISCLVRGKLVRSISGGAFGTSLVYSRNPVECTADYLTSSRYGLGGWVAVADIDLPSFQTAKSYCDDPVEGQQRHRVDLVLDEYRPQGENIEMLLNTFRGYLIESEHLYRLGVDHSASPSQVFSGANILTGSLRLSWISLAEKRDSVELFYLDRDLGYRRESFRWPPSGGVKPKSIQARGITRAKHALREAKYHYGLASGLARVYDWDCALEALAVQVGDVVTLSHPLLAQGQTVAGRVVGARTGATNDVLTVDRGILPTGALSGYQVQIRGAGDQIETYTVVSVAAAYTDSFTGRQVQDVTISGHFTTLPSAQNAHYIFGPSGAVGRSVRIVEATLNEDLTRHLKAIDYLPSLYEATSAPFIEMTHLTYSGDGINGRSLTLPFAADVVLIRRRDTSATARITWRFATWGKGAGNCLAMEDNVVWGATPLIQDLTRTYVTLGTSSHVNASGGIYDLVAFKAGARLVVGTYTGDGNATQVVALLGEPDMIFVTRHGGDTSPRKTIYANNADANVRDTGWGIKDSVIAASGKGIKLEVGQNRFTAQGAGTTNEDMNTSGLTYTFLAFLKGAYNAELVAVAGNGADNRVIALAAIPGLDWVWLQTVEESAPDQGGAMRVGGYDETDLVGQVVEVVSKADFVQKLGPVASGTGSLVLGTKGNKTHASKKNYLYVVYAS